jgi:hypothetical protein
MRELYFTTLDFLIKEIEAKEADIENASEDVNRASLEAQMAHLQRRLHVEFCYLASFSGGGSQAL